MILQKFIKQPVEVKDYDIDYTEWLSATGDTIANVTIAVAASQDLHATPLEIRSQENTFTLVKLWVAGGADGDVYKVSVNVETTQGRLDQSELIFKIKEY